MARIRTIKPEFFTSEDIVSLSPMARLLYIALWCEADREGRMVWKPVTFKMRYFPADTVQIEKLCDEILDAGLVVQYDKYAFIPSFHSHQHINPREQQSQLPTPEIDASTTRQPRVSNASPRDSDVQGGRERKGREGIAANASAPDGVSDSVWQGFKQIRKAKKAPVTDLVIHQIKKEADLAGITLEIALTECVTRGWQSFKADWYKPSAQQTKSQWAGGI